MYYKHSGRFTIGGFALALLTGLGFGALLAYVYGHGLILIPEAHLAGAATLVFGLLVGVGTGLGLLWGKVRNKWVAVAVAAPVSFVALYLSWAVWIAAVLNPRRSHPISWLALANRPGAVWYLMKWVNRYGTWGLDQAGPTKGWELWGIWGAEAAVVIGAAIALAVVVVLSKPFCEACGAWCRRSVDMLLSPTQDPAQLKQQLESKNMRVLEGHSRVSKTKDHLGVTLHSCSTCGQLHTLTVSQVTTQRRRFGHFRVRVTTIVKHLLVGPSEAQTLRSLSENLTRTAQLSPPRAKGAAAGL